MKLMYICGMYVPSHGGAEISMYSILKNLQEKFGWEVLAVTDERYKKTEKLKEFNKINLHLAKHENREIEIERAIVNFKPDIIMTQLMWSDVALKLAKKHSIPSMMRVCKVPLELDLKESSDYSPTAIIATSNSIKRYVLGHWKRESKVIKPLVEVKNYIIKKENFNPFKNKFIFMFNPLQRKGGLVFRKIAERLPSKKFGTVLGWSSLKDNKNSENFSREYIKRITQSEGSTFYGALPDYINFDNCKNVKIFESKDDPRVLYEQTRILLIPSQWEEAFGRVAIEAMSNGIPVIASNVAGLKDSVGGGGILLEKDKIQEWVDEIEKLSDEIYYTKISKKAKKFIKENYSEDKIIDEFKELLEDNLNRNI